MTESNLEAEFDYLCRALSLPDPTKEFRFGAHVAGGPGRGLRERLKALNLQDWRFDRVWLKSRVAVEIEGGTWSGGRHVTGKGYADDCQKYNTAALSGWMVLRFTGDMLRDGRAAATLEDVRGMIET